MSFDVGRVRHLAEQMHRSEDDAGVAIPEDYLLAAAGDSGLKWINPADLVTAPSGANIFFDHGTIGASEVIDGADGVYHAITLDVNTTLTFSGFPATFEGDDVGWLLSLKVIQDGSGGNTITWPVSVVWIDGTPPTLDTTADSVEWLEFITTDGGAVWYGFHGGGSSTDLSDDNPEDVGTAPDPGVGTEASRDDHVHAIDPDTVKDAGRWEHAVITGSPPDDLYADGDWLYIWVP